MLEFSTLQWSGWCKEEIILPPKSPINKSDSTTSQNDNPVTLDMKMCALRDRTLPSSQNPIVSGTTYTNCESTLGSRVDSPDLKDVEHLRPRTASPDFPVDRLAQHIITPSQIHELYLFNGSPEFAGDLTYQSQRDSNLALCSYQPSANDDIWNTAFPDFTFSSVNTNVTTNFAFDCFSNHAFQFDQPPQVPTQQHESHQATVSVGSDRNETEFSSDPVSFETTSGNFTTGMNTSDGRYTFIDAPQEAKIRRDAARRRDMEDRFLLSSRAAGMSFKTIKEQGQFNVAESTLRGRYRALTKDKRDREREPKWTDEDIKALHIAFEREKSDHGENFRWTRVAEMMSYPYTTRNFAAQTCSKKWREIRKG